MRVCSKLNTFLVARRRSMRGEASAVRVVEHSRNGGISQPDCCHESLQNLECVS
jgi:hypothetical protein